MRKFLVLLMLLFLLPASLSSAEENTYSLDDRIPGHVQTENAKLAAMGWEDGGLIRKYGKDYTYDTVIDRYLRMYGIYYDSSYGNTISEWIQPETARLGRSIPVPDSLTTSPALNEWLRKYAQPGDMLFYKANGRADKTLVYVGDTKCVVRRFNDFIVGDVPLSFANDGKRTKSTGIYAIGRLWSEAQQEEGASVSQEMRVDVRLISRNDLCQFEGRLFALMVTDPETGTLRQSGKYIVFEVTPGIYAFWDGTAYGIRLSDLENAGPLGAWVCEYTLPSGMEKLPFAQRLDLSLLSASSEDTEITIPLGSGTQTDLEAVPSQWTGYDLTYMAMFASPTDLQ